MVRKAIIMDQRDNVATMLSDIEKGDVVSVVSKAGKMANKVRAKQPIQLAHKIALRKIAMGTEIIKYGEVIGVSTKCIEKGEHVHVQNVVSRIMR